MAAKKTINMENVKAIRPASPDEIIAYVDGSYDHSIRHYAFGCVFILPDGRVYVENGNGDNPDSAALRNVTGEMLGAMFAVRFAIVNGFRSIEIRYDYEGIEKWVTGAWKSKTELTQKYAQAMRKWSDNVQIRFTKVVAHTNVYYNEMADKLAKEALPGLKGVPSVRKISEMEPVNGTD
ncbi:MAG: reverse transcriptase-like protein [Lachnospiraceae bacterium]|nr:reverse transcriptase-like protein [Lachnospiraceae bacterium]